MSTIQEVNHLQIPLQDISDATNGFSDQNLLGKGGFGRVYKGVSEKHGKIAIKILDREYGQGDDEFKTEIALLSVYKHENIVSLLGYHEQDWRKILVYKYEGNSSLDKHLDNANLTWIQRLQICLDAASGLQYLHDDVGTEHRILHRDVKSSNILLGDDWKAKIADFGLSRVGPANMQSTFLISNACGTIGYIDPDYLNTGYLTQKSDVYSFGVVLFEVLCGRLTRVTRYKDKREFLVNLVKIHWGRKTLDEIIFSDIRKQIDRASFLTFSSIAYQCLMSGNERPTMKKVVEQLRKALSNQQAPSGPWLDYDGFDAPHQENSAGVLEDPPTLSEGPGNERPTMKETKKQLKKTLNIKLGSFYSFITRGTRSDDDDFAAHSRGKSLRSLASSSQSSSWMFDVYISAVKEDSRTSFAEYLYSALERRKIITFNGDNCQRISSIDPHHKNAIQVSRIAIIILSKRYIRTPGCLDELANIMKMKDERGQTVMVIFFNLDPKKVRSLIWTYGKRKTLVRAAKLPGWDVVNGREEYSDCIEKTVFRVSNKLHALTQSSKESADQTKLIGIEARVQELKLLLKVGTGDVHKVAISGMWGSGKSTLASSIYDEISHEFEGCCFVKNVKARSRTHGLKTLQEEILSNVLKINVTLTSIEQGIHMMQNKLRKNSVLIVLDDVNHIEHLDMLAGSREWFGDGSRIIITIRKQVLVRAKRFLIHNVSMLDPKEATELFSKCAFGDSKPAQGLEEVSRKMVSKFDGHPSALISLGSILHGKDMSVLMSILDRLEAIPTDEILKRFKVRNDGVQTNDLLQFLLEGATAESP